MDDRIEAFFLGGAVLVLALVASRLVRAWGELAEARRRKARQPV